MPITTQLGDSESWSRDSLKKLKVKYSRLENYVREGVIKKARSYSEKEEKAKLSIHNVKMLIRSRTTDCLQITSSKKDNFGDVYLLEQCVRDCYEIFVSDDIVFSRFFRILYEVTNSDLSHNSNSIANVSKISHLNSLCLVSFNFYEDHLISIEKQTENDPIRSTTSLLKILNYENKKLSKSLDDYINFIYKNQ